MENIQWKKKNYSAVEDLNILGSKEALAWKLHLQKITPIVSLKK